MFFELQREQVFDGRLVLGRKPAALPEQISQGTVLARGPGGTGLGKTGGIEEVRLESEHTEE
jgi:hypothetical protein